MKQRRSFPESFAEALRASAEKRGWQAFIPYVLVSCIGFGYLATIFIPELFWADASWGISVTVYVGFVTFNALLLAFSQNAFLKIQEMVGTGTMGRVLAKHGLLDETLFAVELNQLFLAISSAVSAIGLITVILPLDLVWDRAVAVLTLSLSLYALIKAYVATREMNSFIWERIHAELDGEIPPTTIPFPKQGNGER
jgi:hypothetical protein